MTANWPENGDARTQRPYVEKEIIPGLLMLNPGVSEANIRAKLEWDGDGIHGWSLNKLGIAKLPASFGHIMVATHLDLSQNLLGELPESMGSLVTGGLQTFSDRSFCLPALRL